MYYGFTYDAVIGGIVLFGGSTDSGQTTTVQDTWAFSSGTWTQLTSSVGSPPSDRGYMMMGFDGADNYTVSFGGASTGITTVPLGDTWILGPEVLARLTISPPAADLGQTVELNATPLASHGSVTFNYTGLPAGCSSQNVTLLNCTPLANGTFGITVHDNSTAGGVSNASVTLTVSEDPSVVSFTSNRSVVTLGSSLLLRYRRVGGFPAVPLLLLRAPAGVRQHELRDAALHADEHRQLHRPAHPHGCRPVRRLCLGGPLGERPPRDQLRDRGPRRH